MNQQQQKKLLCIVRDQVKAAVSKQPSPPAPAVQDAELNEKCGCFVTLKNGDRLRGCIGQFIADKPLYKLVAEMAVASSTKDPRFVYDRIRPAELSLIDVEISVLSPLQKTDDPLSLRLGIDGIYIVKGSRCGCFLPQVATETGWDKEQFLSYCCQQKAAIAPDAWKHPGTDVYLFTADVFGASFAEI